MERLRQVSRQNLIKDQNIKILYEREIKILSISKFNLLVYKYKVSDMQMQIVSLFYANWILVLVMKNRVSWWQPRDI